MAFLRHTDEFFHIYYIQFLGLRRYLNEEWNWSRGQNANLIESSFWWDRNCLENNLIALLADEDRKKEIGEEDVAEGYE